MRESRTFAERTKVLKTDEAIVNDITNFCFRLLQEPETDISNVVNYKKRL